MSVLYIESFSGLSGDMFLGALAGLTDSYCELKKLPELLNLKDGEIKITEVDKNGIVCKHVRVIDLNVLDKKHLHEHHHHHSHRHLSDINKIIENASISEEAKKIAKDIFLIIGKSESKIHNIPLEKIHFHEVSGVDSIIDIVGSAIMIEQLQIKKVYATPVCTGFGFVDTQHGKLPVPAPATADILTGIPHYAGDEKGERVTPTGAAILKYLNPDFNVPVLTTVKTVYGSGSKDFKAPNVLRISLCKTTEQLTGTYVLETNIDDMNNEFLGNDFQNGLFEHGASDFFTSAIQMKKGRQGILLSCSVPGKKIKQLSDYIFDHTSTIGLRYYPVKGNKLEREIKEFETLYGKVKVKIVTTPSGIKKTKIEYDDLKKLQNTTKLPLQLLQHEILKTININE
ncbi:MAG: nickel pincer cofactor biosynthesis protein LarC [Flavobacteriaceae bacterium]|nr:nickel pincer cofactor biosynthesis protein LarC [Flavobacteriaceae bacterium]